MLSLQPGQASDFILQPANIGHAPVLRDLLQKTLQGNRVILLTQGARGERDEVAVDQALVIRHFSITRKEGPERRCMVIEEFFLPNSK